MCLIYYKGARPRAAAGLPGQQLLGRDGPPVEELVEVGPAEDHGAFHRDPGECALRGAVGVARHRSPVATACLGLHAAPPRPHGDGEAGADGHVPGAREGRERRVRVEHEQHGVELAARLQPEGAAQRRDGRRRTPPAGLRVARDHEPRAHLARPEEAALEHGQEGHSLRAVQQPCGHPCVRHAHELLQRGGRLPNFLSHRTRGRRVERRLAEVAVACSLGHRQHELALHRQQHLETSAAAALRLGAVELAREQREVGAAVRAIDSAAHAAVVAAHYQSEVAAAAHAAHHEVVWHPLGRHGGHDGAGRVGGELRGHQSLQRWLLRPATGRAVRLVLGLAEAEAGGRLAVRVLHVGRLHVRARV
eukprot:CAMPEP_0179970144 /NCGR_PEP_ID=MMETSP0983-20121128/35106_1 /TAXON_ID=483367 /ORGANISM="non described non described, Strain CCMP 2436" /LENGTH=362 /DNA_ID=CAMNT_0021884719 /DNA_START=251 /DNA_END=1340 /DNA_ORIENTATION=+